MPLTVAQIEAEVIRPALFGEVLAMVGLDGTTQTGGNLGIRAALRSALRDAQVRVADPIAIADSDVADLTGNLFELVLLTTRINLINEILLSWHRAEKSQSADIEALKRMEDRLRRLLDRYSKAARAMESKATAGGPVGVTVGVIKAGRRVPKCPPPRDPC